MTTKKVLCFILLLLVIVFVLRLWFADPDEPVRVVGMSQGDKIVAALESYNHSAKKYPDSLSELVPSFLPEKDLHFTYGNKVDRLFDYQKYKDEHYELRFTFSSPVGTTSCDYELKVRKWLCGTVM